MANLGKLIKQADAAAESASRLVLRAMREVRGELALLADELNLTGSAADRDKAYQMIQKKMARLSRRLDALMDAQNHLAGKTAAKSAEEMTGLEVKYSAARANAIIELVSPAQGENLAAVFTQNMAANSIRALQEATVAVMREQAVAGGTMKEMKKALGERWQKAISAPPVFTDAGGHTWDTGAYLQMNIRTNTMRVYNDCLVDDVARTTGSDLVRVSTGGDPMCRLCAPWEGVILSVSGKTKGFPTYEQARQAGCFHPNCVHTIETVDDVWDGDEIELQKAHPVTKEAATDSDAMDERKYKMDQERYRRKGMDAEAARLAVDRDNLEANIRHGLIRSDAREIVDKLTDAQVTALCKDGNPPRFEPTKKATKKDPHAADEKFIRGKRGGVVHISRNATVEDLVKVTRVKDKTEEQDFLSLPPSIPGQPIPDDALPYLGNFKPAATIEEAMAYTEKHIGHVDFELSESELGALNRFNEIFADAMKVHGIDRFNGVEIITINNLGESIVAAYKKHVHIVAFNPDAFTKISSRWRNGVKKKEHDDELRKFACPSKEKIREYIGAHEMAHVLFHRSKCPRKVELCEALLTLLNENDKIRAISSYAKENYRELFAELYALRHCGGEIPAEAENILKEILK